MTTDTIKHLGAEFHRAADSLADTLARLDNARLERLTFLRRCSKDSTARLAAIKEELRTLPEQIAKWDAEAARLESQTAEDLLQQALEPKGGDPHALELESRGQVTPPSVGKAEGEPYRAGLPPERLRKVWAEWEDAEGDVVTFKGDRFSWSTWRQANRGALIEHFTASDRPALRPHGATWARVEALADEAEKPTLLDLTKLPPGTVCEALDDIPRWNGRTIAAGVRFTLRDTTTTEGDEFPMVVTTDGKNSYCIPYVVAARVVKEGGEQ
jgi:hypothetical protein